MIPLIPTILCGGSGSRLWPVSREQHPKPFIQLSDGQSLLQKAFLRAASLDNVSEILTVTNRELFFKTQDIYRQNNDKKIHLSYVLEPCAKNTAAAIAAAALQINKHYSEHAVMLVLAADHLISNQCAFADAVGHAIELAAQDYLVTFGIQPSSPEIGYGYIETYKNHPVHDAQTVVLGYEIKRFVEKPDREQARAYLDSGNYLWNSGMFCFTAGTILKHMALYCPDILQATERCINDSTTAEGSDHRQIQLDPQLFALVPENSIDYAVMEPASITSKDSTAVAVVPCDIGWSDIGSWNALGELLGPDAQGNRIEGEAMLHDTSNCYIQSHHRMVGAVGIDNLIIIDTADALLIADKNRAQDVKHIYTQLKNLNHDAHKWHRTVYRPWGSYTVLEEGPNFKIKRIEVKPGASLSLQMHHHRSEHWIMVSGTARVINDDQEFLVRPNESTYISAGHKHRLENPGVLNLVMIEVQSGEYLGEDDIVRFEDNYGRL